MFLIEDNSRHREIELFGFGNQDRIFLSQGHNCVMKPETRRDWFKSV